MRLPFPPAFLATAALLLSSAAGCSTTDVVQAPPVKSPYKYIVGPGDVLSIGVFKDPDLPERDVIVGPDGMISFPLAGLLKVEDRTLPEVETLIRDQLLKVLTSPFVVVTLKESRSAQVQVVGEVGRQGGILFRDRLTVVQAIGIAGGANVVTAKTESVRVIRGSLDDPIMIHVDLDEVFWGAEKDVFLEPGDIVVVPALYVTRMDRYVTQALSPIRNLVGTARAGVPGVP